MRIQTVISNIIGNRTTLETLTAALSGNETDALLIENCKNISLPVHFLAGVINQYAEIRIEVSNKSTTPSSDNDWEIYPAIIASATETQVFANDFVIPGDKVSTITTRERTTIALDVNAKWLRVSVRERTNAGGNPTTFGTIFIGLSKHEEG